MDSLPRNRRPPVSVTLPVTNHPRPYNFYLWFSSVLILERGGGTGLDLMWTSVQVTHVGTEFVGEIIYRDRKAQCRRGPVMTTVDVNSSWFCTCVVCMHVCVDMCANACVCIRRSENTSGVVCLGRLSPS